MAFDFDTAVSAPFRMQPGLRRLAPGSAQLTPLAPGSRHQREKLAVLTAFWPQALCVQAGFDPVPALHALFAHAALEQPHAWAWDGERAHALALGTAVRSDGQIEPTAPGVFGLGDEIGRCLEGLPAHWRLAGLLSLSFAEDFAIIDGASGTIPWLAVALPSHWAPETKIGRHFREVHAPVADNQLLLRSGDALMRMVTGPERWERFVWNVTDRPQLHAHPARTGGPRWQHTTVAQAWWRTERQSFIPLPAWGQAVFTIGVEVQRLADAIHTPQHAAALHAAIETMSPAVLEYRNLHPVREPLLAWLAARR